MKYMLDTNICIELIRRRSNKLIQRLTRCQPGEVGVSSITVAGLIFGANKSNQVGQNLAALEQFLLPLEIADFGQPAANAYGAIRARLEREGRAIGSMDTLIGAHAVSCGTIIVTNNTGEFRRIRGQKVEDWSA